MTRLSPPIKAARVSVLLEDGTEYDLQFGTSDADGRPCPIEGVIDLRFDVVEGEPKNGFRNVQPGTQRGTVTLGGVVVSASRRTVEAVREL